MIYRNITVPVPHKGVYFQGSHKAVYFYTKHFRNKNNNNMPSHKSVSIGVCVSPDNTSLMHPNDNYYKLIDTNIPQEVFEVRDQKEKREALKSSGKQSANTSLPAVESGDIQGIALLIAKLAQRLSLDKCLSHALAHNSDAVTAVLMIASMLCKGHSAMMHLPDYLRRCNYLDELALSDRSASELFAAIDAKVIENFFKSWIKLNYSHNGTVFYDVTSLSTYSQNLNEAEYGYNRDNENLPQLNLGILLDKDTSLPLYYGLYNGSINDASQLPYVFAALKKLKLDIKLLCTMDRGFADKKRLTYMHECGINVLVGLSLALNNTLYALLDPFIAAGNQFNPDYLLPSFPGIYGLKQNYTLHDISGTLYFYYDPAHLQDDLIAVQERYAELKAEVEDLRQGKNLSEPLSSNKARKYQRFFKVSKNEKAVCGWDFTFDPELYRKAMLRCGWFCLFTDVPDTLSADEALKRYRSKEAVECAFDSLKNTLDGKRFRTHNDKTTGGKMFVEFISLILHNRLLAAQNELKRIDLKRYRKLTVGVMVRELSDVIFTKDTSGNIKLKKAPTATQKAILDALGISLDQFTVGDK